MMFSSAAWFTKSGLNDWNVHPFKVGKGVMVEHRQKMTRKPVFKNFSIHPAGNHLMHIIVSGKLPKSILALVIFYQKL